MTVRTPFLGQSGDGEEGPGSLRAFAADPGSKWSPADGQLVADLGATYPALARVAGVAYFGDEQSFAGNPNWPLSSVVAIDPANGSAVVIDGVTGGARSTDGGATWTPLGYPVWPAALHGWGGDLYRALHAFGNGMHVWLQVRQVYATWEDPPGSGVWREADDRRVWIGRTLNAGVSWQMASAWIGVFLPEPFANEPTDLVFSPALGLFVMVTLGGAVYTSVDGLTWTQRHAAGFSLTWIVWNAALARFFAGGGGAAFRQSVDGVNWTAVNLPSGSATKPMPWPGGAIMFSGASIYRTLDGSTWSLVGLPQLQALDPALGLTGPVTLVRGASGAGGAVLWLDLGASVTPRHVYYSTGDLVLFVRGSAVADTLVSDIFVIGQFAFKHWVGTRRYRLRSGIRKPRCDTVGGRRVYIKLKD